MAKLRTVLLLQIDVELIETYKIRNRKGVAIALDVLINEQESKYGQAIIYNVHCGNDFFFVNNFPYKLVLIAGDGERGQSNY